MADRASALRGGFLFLLVLPAIGEHARFVPGVAQQPFGDMPIRHAPDVLGVGIDEVAGRSSVTPHPPDVLDGRDAVCLLHAIDDHDGVAEDEFLGFVLRHRADDMENGDPFTALPVCLSPILGFTRKRECTDREQHDQQLRSR